MAGAVALAAGTPGASAQGSGTPAAGTAASALLLPARTAVDDWTGAAQRLRSSPRWAQWLAGERSAVDQWMGRGLERADLVAGWVHDYIDDAGRPRRWSADDALPDDGPGERQARKRQAWVASMREINVLRMQAAARLFRLTGEARYAQWAAGQLDAYAAQYNRWPLRTENGRGRMFRHGLDEATSSFPLLDTARLLEDWAGAARRDRWRDGLFLPMARNLQTVTSRRTNIDLWHHAAIAAIALRHGDDALLARALQGPEGLLATLAQGLTADDIWYEGSFSYNNYVVESLARLLVLASLERHDAAVAPLRAAVQRALLGVLPLRFDNGLLPTPNDGARKTPALDDRLHLMLVRVLPTRHGVQLASQNPSWDALLDPPPPPAQPPALPPAQTKDFPAVRMAVLRAGDWQAFVHYGQVTPNHAQEEALGYELHHGTTPLSEDTGTTSYASAYHRDYFSRGPANNVPLVDGQGPAGAAPGRVVSFSAADAALTVEHAAYRGRAVVQRSYRVTADGFAEGTSIDAAGTARRLGAAFHSPCAMAPSQGLKPSPGAPPPPANATTAYWRDVQRFDASGPNWSVQLDCPGGRYRLEVTGPSGQRVYLATAPDTPLPATRRVLYYEVEDSKAQFDLRVQRAR